MERSRENPGFFFYGGDVVSYLILLGVLVWSAYTDLQNRVIPNYISITILALGLYQHCTNQTCLMGLAGLAITTITLIPYGLQVLGAGDVKLFMSLGFLLGPVVLGLIIVVLFLISLFSAFAWIRHRRERIHVPLAPFVLSGYLILGGVVFVSKYFYAG